jgi:MFS family permease
MSDRSAVRRLALGSFLSGTGSGIAGVALSFFVFERTNSAIWLAGTLFFTFGVAGLITPFAGKIVDRYDRRRVMIASDLLSLATWGTLVFIRAPVLLAGIGFVATVVALPYWFAAAASIPNLVEETDLPWANGLTSAAASTARLLGAGAGRRAVRAGRSRARVRRQRRLVRRVRARHMVRPGPQVLRRTHG